MEIGRPDGKRPKEDRIGREEWGLDQRRHPPFGKNNSIMIGDDKDEGRGMVC